MRSAISRFAAVPSAFVRRLIAILTFASSVLPASAADRLTVTDPVGSSPMRFARHTEGPADRCRKVCRTWISAAGVITLETAREFDRFAQDNNIQGATLVLDSQGGSVVAALALGRAIRRLDMTTMVGKTITIASSDGDARAKLSPNASCESMCAFVLLGGVRRYVPPEADILVHMVWLANKRDHAQEVSYTAHELGMVQQDIGSLAKYTVEMGGSIELLEAALRTPPWEPLHALAEEELRRMRLTTPESEEEISLLGPNAVAHVNPGAPEDHCTVWLLGRGL
jgi:hypothetical protein